MRSLTKYIFIAAMFFFPSAGFAQMRDMEIQAHSHPETVLLKCELGEAGFRMTVDHQIIPFVLYRRAMRRFSQDQIAAMSTHEIAVRVALMATYYCSALKRNPPRNNSRAMHIRGMTYAWIVRHADLRIVDFVNHFLNGEEVEDPCPTAIHWGSYHDAFVVHHYRHDAALNCGATQNYFFDSETPALTPRWRWRH